MTLAQYVAAHPTTQYYSHNRGRVMTGEDLVAWYGTWRDQGVVEWLGSLFFVGGKAPIADIQKEADHVRHATTLPTSL